MTGPRIRFACGHEIEVEERNTLDPFRCPKCTTKLKEVIEQDYVAHRQLPDGRYIAIRPMMYTTGLFVGLDAMGYAYRYCYANLALALVDMAVWDGKGDPPGPWIKQKPPNRLNPKLADPEVDFGDT